MTGASQCSVSRYNLRQRLKHRQSETVCLRGGFCSFSPWSLVLDPPRYFNLLMLSGVRVSVIYSKVSSFCTCSGKSPLVTSTCWPVFAIGKETVGQFHVFASYSGAHPGKVLIGQFHSLVAVLHYSMLLGWRVTLCITPILTVTTG